MRVVRLPLVLFSDVFCDSSLLDWTYSISLRERFAPVIHCPTDCRRHLISARVREADVEHRLSVSTAHLHSLVDGSQHVRFDELSLTQNSDAGTISVH